MVVIGGCAGKLKLPGRYIQFPQYKQQGHYTLGNWWTSVLNAFGDPIKHYGDSDPALAAEGLKQEGAIAELDPRPQRVSFTWAYENVTPRGTDGQR